ncbi:LCP family protein [Paenibacillus sp. GCM10027626]|uniref:LCP family protein n=1 Tax=Paenibacillus sp. GCM10027626 TaxID=3273411 RepID=UPI00363958F8
MDEKQLRKKTIIRRVLIGCAVAAGTTLIAVGAYAGFLANKTDSTLKKIAANPQQVEQKQQTNEAVPDLSDEDKRLLKPMTLLLSGIDSRDGSGGTINTDVMMLASFNPDTRSASILSVPRDLRIESDQGSDHKANYYYAHNFLKDKTTAMENTKQFFSELFEVPIDYMVMIDFDGLRQVVDEVGGLDIDVDMDMRYVDSADGTDINLRKGLQHLDGKQTLDFVRYRKSNRGTAESTDPARNHRQQMVLSQVMDKLASFEGMTQWGNVLDIVGNNVKTDIPVDNLRNWIYNFRKLKPDRLTFLPLESDWKSPYMFANKDQLIDAFAKLREEVGGDPEKKSLSKRIGTYTGSSIN